MNVAILSTSILISSFLGSWHCAVMCSPVATLMTARQGLWRYHFGRLFAYATLGALAGYVGNFFLANDFVIIRWVTALLLSLTLFYSGFRLIFPPSHQKDLFGKFSLFKVLQKTKLFRVTDSSFLVGLLTVFLPCGWLYTYLAAAITTQSAFAGALVMILFWLGGLPALSTLPWMIKKLVRAADNRQKKIAGWLLVGASLYSIGSFVFLT